MDQDATFRPLLVVGFLAVVLITLYHRIKSWASRERLDRRQEGLFILVTLRVTGLVLWVGVIAYMVNPACMGWSAVRLPGSLRWGGVGISVMAVGLLTWTLRSLGTNLTDTVVTRQVHTMVTHGPYRWVRHPFYDSLALVILAFALMAANWFILLTGGVLLLHLVVRTRREEENLLARFGDDYKAYMMRTGRFVPRSGRDRRSA